MNCILTVRKHCAICVFLKKKNGKITSKNTPQLHLIFWKLFLDNDVLLLYEIWFETTNSNSIPYLCLYFDFYLSDLDDSKCLVLIEKVAKLLTLDGNLLRPVLLRTWRPLQIITTTMPVTCYLFIILSKKNLNNKNLKNGGCHPEFYLNLGLGPYDLIKSSVGSGALEFWAFWSLLVCHGF